MAEDIRELENHCREFQVDYFEKSALENQILF